MGPIAFLKLIWKLVKFVLGVLRPWALVIALIASFLIVGVELGGSFRATWSLFDGLGTRVTEVRDKAVGW
ncbi:MAG: hypothetical protein AAGM22_22280, partial [Acidobacteriota bacterium]